MFAIRFFPHGGWTTLALITTLFLAGGGWVGAQNLLVSNANDGRVLEYDFNTGAFVREFIPAGVAGAMGIRYGPNGNLFVCTYDRDSVMEFDGATGAFVRTVVSPGNPGNFDQPWGLTWAAPGTLRAGMLFVSCAMAPPGENRCVYSYGADGVYSATYPCLGPQQTPLFMTTRPYGAVGRIFVSWNNHVFPDSPGRVTEHTLADGSPIRHYQGQVSRQVTGLAFHPNGDLLLADFNGNRVWRFETTGTSLFATSLGSFLGGGGYGVRGPRDLVYGPNGNLFVVGGLSNNIQEYDGTTGAFIRQVVAGNGLDGPWGLAFRPGEPPQACCRPDGTCEDLTPAQCLADGGVNQGPDTTCATTACPPPPPPPTQACCLPVGGCLDLAPPGCLALLGTPQGPGTTCATTVCPLPVPLADYGDAPDGIPACQGTIFCTTPSSYPTLFGTTNAAPGRGAPYHTDFTDVWLGPQPNSETAEPVAFQPCCSWLTPPPDCDDAPIVLCLDGPCTTGVLSTMSGCPEAVNIPFGLTPSGFGYWIYETAVGAGAPDVPRFVNVTVDWTLSGTYGDVPGEWVVVDASVPYTPGTAAIMLTAPFPTPTVVPSTTGGLGWAIEPFWTRFTVSRDPIAPAFPAGDWDGSGPLPPGYVYGETEDLVPFTDPQTPLPRFPDCDHNGVPDLVDIIMGRLEDANHNRIPDVVEPGPDGDMPFDADRDGDVDQADYGAVQACMTGSGDPGHAFDPTACSGFDRDFDRDVDRADLEAFLRCVSGPGLPADPDCGRVRMLRITQPANGAVLSGITRVVIEHPADLPLTEIVSLRLQSLRPAEPLNWIPYATLTDPELDSGGVLLNTWDVGLDPMNWPEPLYQFRAALRKTDGQTLYSDPIELKVNRPPTPQAQAVQTPQPGSVHFKAFHSWDDHGPITRWHWDFGDSTSAEGPAVEHTFANPKQTYHVVLTVEDDQQAEASAYYTVRFQPRFSFMQDEKCICKKMTLRTEGAAFGADGAPDGKKWPAVPGHHDGGTLGPLHGNPGNGSAGGEKNNTGFAFEVVTDVEGNPAKCTEIQLIRRTTVLKGVTKADCDRLKGTWNAKDATCAVDKSWTGKTADLNKDGTDDIDVSTAAKCGAAGGAWDEASGTCRLAFPQEKLEGDPPRNVARYGPDSIPNQPQGAAERPYDFKKYVGNRIIWWDAPRFGGVGNGSTQKADFIAIVRGTDGKYCYKTFSLELEKKKGQDTEKLTETGGDCGAASVPGVP